MASRQAKPDDGLYIFMFFVFKAFLQSSGPAAFQ